MKEKNDSTSESLQQILEEVAIKHKEDAAKDAVNNPAHYAAFAIEVIDAIEAWHLDFRLANVVKYVARAPHKGKQFEDLKKALWYIARFMKTEFPEEYARDHQKIVKSLDLLEKK